MSVCVCVRARACMCLRVVNETVFMIERPYSCTAGREGHTHTEHNDDEITCYDDDD